MSGILLRGLEEGGELRVFGGGGGDEVVEGKSGNGVVRGEGLRRLGETLHHQVGNGFGENGLDTAEVGVGGEICDSGEDT